MDLDGEGLGSAVAFEIAPAALFGVAVGFAAAHLAAQAAQFVTAGVAGAAAFLASWRWLGVVGSSAALQLPAFEQVPIEESEPPLPAAGEEPPAAVVTPLPGSIETTAPAAEELLLDDILATLGPDSRVVRLFQPQHSPTPGELQARIDHHLRSTPQRIAPPDASEALHEAIAELRRSLR